MKILISLLSFSLLSSFALACDAELLKKATKVQTLKEGASVKAYEDGVGFVLVTCGDYEGGLEQVNAMAQLSLGECTVLSSMGKLTAYQCEEELPGRGRFTDPRR